MSANKTLPGVNPVVQMFLSFLLVALAIFGQAHAADKVALADIAGFGGSSANADDGPLKLSFSGIDANGKYTVTASRVVAIFTTDPGIEGASKLRDSYDAKKFVWIVKALPAGTKLYAIGLAGDWAGNGPGIDGIDLAKAKASGVIEKGVAKLEFVKPDNKKAQVVTWVIVFLDGKRAWGPNGADGDGYHVHVGGKPATAWRLDEIGKPILDPTRQLLAAQK